MATCQSSEYQGMSRGDGVQLLGSVYLEQGVFSFLSPTSLKLPVEVVVSQFGPQGWRPRTYNEESTI